MNIETLAVHAGRSVDSSTGAVTPPIHLSTTFERSPNAQYPLGYEYSRETNPNRKALEECLAALEGGTEALCFGSGMAAANAILQGLEPGDHLIVSDDLYYGLRRLIYEVFPKQQLDTTYVDLTSLDTLKAALRPNTRLIWLETPSNPLLKVVDLSGVAAIARQTRAITICDSTFAPPVCQRPLEWEIDMVMHSTTKYIGGHSDLTGGVLIRKHENYLFERARKAQIFGGGVPSPFDCWLALRGVATLPLRVRSQSASAMRLAECLTSHSRVESVHYPGLPSHPGYDVAARQMGGVYGGMVSFQVKGGRAEALAVAARTRLFTRATSLGGVHSLIEHRASIEGSGTHTPQNLLRLSIGIEHTDDLWADLMQALNTQ